MGVEGGGLSAASGSTRRERVAHDGIVAAEANLVFFFDSCSSHLMLANKETINKTPEFVVLKRTPARAARSRRVLPGAAERPPQSTPTVVFLRNVQLKKFLEGGLWTRLRNGSNTPPRTSSPQSEPVATSKPVPDRKSKSAKRKRDCLTALIDVRDDDFMVFPCRSCSQIDIYYFCRDLHLAGSA
ncbi:hypothetical protein Y032_0021g280 [Ancylostoma ceylanicum]|uniref:Uncharacterized protein n=1 Tax=Ancylostoma ceylanicum TaxID=53326 RepID=A0A016V1J3_9BILA|nr:hypothetical protein Y032_0021g280 [Ancylostoma ceylanicum]